MGIFTGRLEYKSQKFTFVFDGEIIKLIPDDSQVIDSWTHTELAKGVYVPDYPVEMEEACLVGHCNETRCDIVFIFAIGSTISQHNDTLSVKPRAYILCTNKLRMVDSISFTCPELDTIYPVKYAYHVPINREIIESGTYSVESKKAEEYTTEERVFVYDGKEVRVSFSISKYLRSENRTPLEYVSTLHFCIENTNDYVFIYKLTYVALNFLCYLCYRKNVSFDSINLFGIASFQRQVKIADMTLIRHTESDDYQNIKNRVIPYQYFAGYEGKLFQEIADNQLYLRHLPLSYRLGRTINASTFVMTTAAFEWEFRQLFPEGVQKRKQTKDAEEQLKELFKQLISERTGKQKSILKSMAEHIGDDSLSSEIQYVGKELGDVLNPFGEYLYRINDVGQFKYSEVGNRVGKQRNDFAHGNIDNEFRELALLDIMFLQKMVLAMQLKKLGIPGRWIVESINVLFQTHIDFRDYLNESIEKEIDTAQSIVDNNPVLQTSPGDLKRENCTVEEYLDKFTEEERRVYLEYYEEEL